MNKYRIDVFVCDDHRLFCEGLASLFSRSDEIRISRTFSTLAACRQALCAHRPDVLLLDISMPDGDGIVFCRQVLTDYPKVRIVALTVHDEYAVIRRMMDCGAHGYVLKGAGGSELHEAIVSVWKGGSYLSPAVADIVREGTRQGIVLTEVEESILRLICEGLANPEIANRVGLSTETVNWYRKRLLAKCGVRNTAALVRVALQEGLV